MDGQLIVQIGTAVGAAQIFPHIVRQIVGIHLIQPRARREAGAKLELAAADRTNKVRDAASDLLVARMESALSAMSTGALIERPEEIERLLAPLASVLADEDHRTLRAAANLSRIVHYATKDLPPEIDLAVQDRGGLDDEWLETFRGWGKAASKDSTQQLLAQLLRAEIVGENRYPASFISKLRGLDEDAARGFAKIAGLVFGPIGVVRIFGVLNDDPTLQKLGLKYQDFINAEDERLLDRDKETQWEFGADWIEYTVGNEIYRFRAVSDPGKHPTMRLTPFGFKVWTLMPKAIDLDYLDRVRASCAEKGIECERLA